MSVPTAARWLACLRYLFTTIALIASSLAVAQVCATPGKDSAPAAINGVVNSYYPGTAARVAAGTQTIAIGSMAAGGSSAASAAGD